MFTASNVSAGAREVVTISGEVDFANYHQLVDALMLTRSAEVVVIDFADLDFIDSWGLNAILRAHEAAPATRFELRNTSSFQRRLLRVVGVDVSPARGLPKGSVVVGGHQPT